MPFPAFETKSLPVIVPPVRRSRWSPSPALLEKVLCAAFTTTPAVELASAGAVARRPAAPLRSRWDPIIEIVSIDGTPGRRSRPMAEPGLPEIVLLIISNVCVSGCAESWRPM